jgi:hypothetical protein
VQPEDFPTCDSALEVSGVRNVDQVSDQNLTRLEEGPEEEEEVAEHKANNLRCNERTGSSQKIHIST